MSWTIASLSPLPIAMVSLASTKMNTSRNGISKEETKTFNYLLEISIDFIDFCVNNTCRNFIQDNPIILDGNLKQKIHVKKLFSRFLIKFLPLQSTRKRLCSD